MTDLRVALAALACGMALCACAKKGAGTTPFADEVPLCTPGKQTACMCNDGAPSVRDCSKDRVLGPCQCDSSSSGTKSAGTGVSTKPKPSSGSDAGSEPAPTGAYKYGSSACNLSDTTLILDGDTNESLHEGKDEISVARFVVDESDDQTLARFNITPSGQEHGSWWSASFSSSQFDQPLEAKDYPDAERYPFQTYKKPGLEISGNGLACNTLDGRFEVTELEWSGSTLKRFTASFEQHCDMEKPTLHGCIHYVRSETDSGVAGAGGM